MTPGMARFMLRHHRFFGWWYRNVRPLLCVRHTRRAIGRRRAMMYLAWAKAKQAGDSQAAFMAAGECYALDWVMRLGGKDENGTTMRLKAMERMLPTSMPFMMPRDPKERGH